MAAINAAMGLPADYTHNTGNTGRPAGLAGLGGGLDRGDGGDDVPVVQVCAHVCASRRLLAYAAFHHRIRPLLSLCLLAHRFAARGLVLLPVARS